MHLRRPKLVTTIAAVGATCTAVATVVIVGGTAHAATASRPFPQHVTYQQGVMPSASQSARDAAVTKQYDSWKANYLVNGCASNEYYVSTKGDGDATNNGTVSEAQGYGMNIVPLMAGYDSNAQTEFNGMWQLVKNHQDQYGLMQWQLDGITCNYYSGGTPDSATDGDLDIGYGLILADRQWGGYTADALSWLGRIYAHDVTSDGHLKCEDDGPSTDTRPSDNMLDHLRAFAAYDTAHDWNKVVSRMEALTTAFTNAYSPSAGLESDFVVNANTNNPSPAPATYQESQPDNIVGYNSIRVPWHMGTDALLFGSTTAAVSSSIAAKEAACYRNASGGNPLTIQPHVNLNCTWANKSGDTQAEEAGDSVGPSAMAAGDQTFTDAIWNELGTNPFGDHYYGETIKMLVYLVMSGNYWSPIASSPPPPGNDFSVSVSPVSGSVVAGQSASVMVSTAVTSGSVQSVALSASGLPSGVSVSFNPGSVSAGGSSTLTVATSTSTVPGTYPVTVTGTAASGTHTTTYSLTVTTGGGGGNAIVNGGFETGDFTGWTRSGTTSIVTSPVHSGTRAVLLGSANPTNGDSKVTQTFTAPTGSTQLSFWYNINCPDDVAWDWATATVKDNTTGVTSTVLAKTCTVNQGWKQATANISAGHSYTLTLVSHDENNPGDATDTSYDDVTINGSAPADDFSVSVSPASGSVVAGQSSTATVSTAVTSGAAQSVALSVSGLPSGATASFNPATVTAGANSTLSVATSTSTPAGTYPITVTGTAASGTHTTTFTLTITTGGGGGSTVVNGGFETGDFTGWTRSGTTSIVTSPVHSGTRAALLGSANPTNGDSKVSQTFTAPTGSTQLSFWYNINCPDDVAWDWTTATLKDNTTGVTSTVLAKTCTLNQGWKQITANITAGHSYTLTLISHDENNPGDATNTTYDDITTN